MLASLLIGFRFHNGVVAAIGMVIVVVMFGVALTEAVRALDGVGLELADLTLRRPSLDDVFLKLTGHAAEQQKAS